MMSDASSTTRHDDNLGTELPAGSRVRAQRLANGLWIMAAHVPTARRLRLVGAVGAGYLDEPDERLGLAHLLEHALFLGSAGWPEVSGLGTWVGEQGGRYNAHTSEISTDVHLSLPPEAAEAGLERLVDLLCRPCFDVERIAREVDVLDAEFRARLADPALHRLAALGQLYRPQHPASACHAGNRATLGGDAASLAADLSDFHRRHYRPRRMALAILGPRPLEEQFALLERHGSLIGIMETSAETEAENGRMPCDEPTSRAWRWGEPAGIAWQLPDAPSARRRSTLELLWPLPDTLAVVHAEWLTALSARLSDGALAATLRQAVDLESLDVSLSPPGTGSALMLHLAFSGAPSAREALVATCQLAVERAQANPPPQRPHPSSLDAWPREQACRLAGGMTASVLQPPATASREALAAWLAADQCRLLWQGHASIDDTWRRLAHTGTAVRALPFPSSISSTTAMQPLPARPAPRLVSSIPPDDAPDTPCDSPSGSTLPALWWGDLDWPGTEDFAHYCLGWPTAPLLHQARLAHWRRHGLPLCQAARSHGLSLTLGGDERGDWLIAAGVAQRLPALVDRAVTTWLAMSKTLEATTLEERTDTAPGLIAQHLLTCLETEPLSPPDTPRASAATDRVLCWAGGAWDVSDVASATQRLSERLPRVSHTPEVDTQRASERDAYRWLPAMGEDRAVMLEIAGLDDSPRSRWLLRLLGHCHDAAFHREMRQHRQLGYAAAVRYRESAGWPKLGYVIQSPHATLDTLRHAIDEFLEDRGIALARLDADALACQRRGLLARHGPPETWREALEQGWLALRRRSPVARPADVSSPWGAFHHLSLDGRSPWRPESAALDALTLDDLTAQAVALTGAALPRRWWAHIPSSSS